MKEPVLILDTNVIVSSLRSSLGASYRLVGLIDRGLFEIGLTAALVFEYESICKRMLGSIALRPCLADPGDDLVLEAAVASGSDWIVTHNAKDFSALSTRYGIEVLSPGEALRRLGVNR